jgi:hypothetical protein
MLEVMRGELTRRPGGKRFVYWLTLTSHFPLAPGSPRSSEVCSAAGLTSDAVCAQWTALWPVLRGIASLASDSTLPPAWYVVVGDHSPHLLIADDDVYSRDRVPYVTLRPKN